MSVDAADMRGDPALLKSMKAALHTQHAKMTVLLRPHDQLSQILGRRIAKLKKHVFSESSEKMERETELLEPALEDLLAVAAESTTGPGMSTQGHCKQTADRSHKVLS